MPSGWKGQAESGSADALARSRCRRRGAHRRDCKHRHEPAHRQNDTTRARRTVFGMASTQDALYSELDLDLSWSEAELPERERTKHVHRLHPYLGKFIPQLVEAMLDRYVPVGGSVLDPFAGSGTTLVQALESGLGATGIDLAAFNCLLIRVKTAQYNPFTLEY